MDNFYFIGYRFDCISKEYKDSWELSDQLSKKDISIYGLPSKDWMTWTHSDGETASVLCMDIKGIPTDYRCPIDREELWQEMHGRSFDVPDEFNEHKKILLKEPIYKELIKIFGKENVALKWGIFLGLG